MKTTLFPSRTASGKAFCNREKERDLLINNILHLRHTLIISPRRYGKTSLAFKTMSKKLYLISMLKRARLKVFIMR